MISLQSIGGVLGGKVLGLDHGTAALATPPVEVVGDFIGRRGQDVTHSPGEGFDVGIDGHGPPVPARPNELLRRRGNLGEGTPRLLRLDDLFVGQRRASPEHAPTHLDRRAFAGISDPNRLEVHGVKALGEHHAIDEHVDPPAGEVRQLPLAVRIPGDHFGLDALADEDIPAFQTLADGLEEDHRLAPPIRFGEISLGHNVGGPSRDNVQPVFGQVAKLDELVDAGVPDYALEAEAHAIHAVRRGRKAQAERRLDDVEEMRT